MDKEKFFSREALDKLRSPEKLNTLIPVTNPIAWVGLNYGLCRRRQRFTCGGRENYGRLY